MLAPAEKSSITRARFRLARRHTTYVGIDIGIDRVEMAMFGFQRERSAELSSSSVLGWKSRWRFPLPIDPSAPPPPNWVDLIVGQLKDRLPRCVGGDRNLCAISLPLPWIHYEISSAAEVASAQQQCDAMFSGSLFQCSAHLRHWPVAADGDDWVIAAVAASAASEIGEAVVEVGYQVEAILPHGVALHYAATQLTSLQPAAVVVLELTGGLVSISEESRCGLSRNLPSCQWVAGRQPFVDELEPWLQEIASEVTATVRYASRLGGSVEPNGPVLLCGSVAEIAGVDAMLATLLERPVATWCYAGRVRPDACRHHDAWQHHEATEDDKALSTTDSESAVALSLAFAATDLDDSRRPEVK